MNISTIDNKNNIKSKEITIWTTKKMAITGLMGAISAILMVLEFPVPLAPTFVKMDFSELDKCRGCKICYSKCPQKCIKIDEKPLVIQQSHCLHCGNCKAVCPFGAVIKR